MMGVFLWHVESANADAFGHVHTRESSYVGHLPRARSGQSIDDQESCQYGGICTLVFNVHLDIATRLKGAGQRSLAMQ